MQSAARAQEAEEEVERFVRNMARTAVIAEGAFSDYPCSQKDSGCAKIGQGFHHSSTIRNACFTRINEITNLQSLLRHGCMAGRQLRTVTLTEDNRFEWTMIANVEVKFVLNGALGCGVACGMFISCCK